MSEFIDDITVDVSGDKLIYKNFQGLGNKFSPEGLMSFGLILDPEKVPEMKRVGWNVKTRYDYQDNVEFHFLTIRVNFSQPVTLVNKSNNDVFVAHKAYRLDAIKIRQAKICFAAHEWETRGQRGVIAYLKSLEFTI